MKRKIQLTESELIDVIKRIINEQEEEQKKGLFGKIKDMLGGGGRSDKEIESLIANTGKVKYLGLDEDGLKRYEVNSYGQALNEEHAEYMAIFNARVYIMEYANKKNTLNGFYKNKKVFRPIKPNDMYTIFLTYTASVNK